MSRKIKILVISNPLSDWSMNANRCLASFRGALRAPPRAAMRAGRSPTSRRRTFDNRDAGAMVDNGRHDHCMHELARAQ